MRANSADQNLAEAHRNYAGILAANNDHAALIAHYSEAFHLKPDYTKVVYILAGLQGEDTQVSAPTGYIAGLFDQYADEFDSYLINVLGVS